MKQNIILLLFFVGFILRFAGIFFDGNHNFDTYSEWGYNTRTKGLADSFTGGYGPIAYLIMGLADKIGAFTPHIWWMPYKATNLIFEVLVLFVLFGFLSQYKLAVIFMYWLNPWFLIPGSWAGFWDAAFMFLVLLTVSVLDNLKNKKQFFLSGLLFGIAFCLKPQIIAPLTILIIYFGLFYLVRFKFKEMILFVLGFFIVPFIFNTYFFLQAKGFLFFPKVYSSFIFYMPFLVNSEINVWHTVTRIIMSKENLQGPIYSMNTKFFPYNLMETGAQIIYMMLIISYVLRFYKNKKKNIKLLWTKLFAFPFILMPQILTRSHVYHFYPATLLLIPIIILEKDKKLFIFWSASVLIHFFNIFASYGFGRSIINPFPLSFWREPYISVFGFIQFLATLGLIYASFDFDRKTKTN